MDSGRHTRLLRVAVIQSERLASVLIAELELSPLPELGLLCIGKDVTGRERPVPSHLGDVITEVRFRLLDCFVSNRQSNGPIRLYMATCDGAIEVVGEDADVTANGGNLDLSALVLTAESDHSG
jgi:hypothetical protein